MPGCRTEGPRYEAGFSDSEAETLLAVARFQQQLGENIPELPAYDSSKHPKEPWEDEIAAGIEELRKSAQAEK